MDLYSLQIFSPAPVSASVHWTTYVTAFLTPVIAALAVWIAFSQWRTARNKLKLDLYDKRVVVYEAARQALATAVMSRKFGVDSLHEYTVGITGAKWLFDEAMSTYLNDQLFYELLDFDSGESSVELASSDEERTAAREQRTTSLSDLHKQFLELDKKFLPFLNVKH